ncbi:MAG: dTDP-4-dehydrorhamnose 3,5-epimerase [Candidatus Pelagibacter sp.]|nr:dTDP-4-dehydrorhamnose 3,5-epimerase [Candidatus Pelagibacter sp.]
MKIVKTKFKGLYVFEGQTFKDQRGFLRECFRKKIIKRNLVFSIVSKSKKNVLRGLHLQVHKPQEKFLTVLKGKILDVAVDLRRSSKTFGKHFKIILSEKKSNHLLIPKGFAHGFLSLEKESIVLYNCSTYRYKKGERSIIWNDKDLKIRWGIKNPVVSKKDQKGLTLKEFIK